MTIVALYLLVWASGVIALMLFILYGEFQVASRYPLYDFRGNFAYGITLYSFILIGIPSLIAALLTFKKKRIGVYATCYSMIGLGLVIFLTTAYQLKDFGFTDNVTIIFAILSLVHGAFLTCMIIGWNSYKD